MCVYCILIHACPACMVYAWSICMHVLTKKSGAHTHAWRWSKGSARTWSQINQAQNFPQEHKKLNGSHLLKGPWGLPSQNIHVKHALWCTENRLSASGSHYRQQHMCIHAIQTPPNTFFFFCSALISSKPVSPYQASMHVVHEIMNAICVHEAFHFVFLFHFWAYDATKVMGRI